MNRILISIVAFFAFTTLSIADPVLIGGSTVWRADAGMQISNEDATIYHAMLVLATAANDKEAVLYFGGLTSTGQKVQLGNYNLTWAKTGGINNNNSNTSGQASGCFTANAMDSTGLTFTEKCQIINFGTPNGGVGSLALLSGKNGSNYDPEPDGWLNNYGHELVQMDMCIGVTAVSGCHVANNDRLSVVGNLDNYIGLSVKNASTGVSSRTSIFAWDDVQYFEHTYLSHNYTGTYLSGGPSNGARAVLNTSASGAPIMFGIGGVYAGQINSTGLEIAGKVEAVTFRVNGTSGVTKSCSPATITVQSGIVTAMTGGTC